VVIHFKSNKLKKQLTDAKTMLKAFGQRAKMINQRIKELKAANNLAVLKTLPAANCHQLKGYNIPTLAVDASSNYRLIFEVAQQPIPQTEEGGLDWEVVTEIEILEVLDYH
jgi:proteic killer suppression protein